MHNLVFLQLLWELQAWGSYLSAVRKNGRAASRENKKVLDQVISAVGPYSQISGLGALYIVLLIYETQLTNKT